MVNGQDAPIYYNGSAFVTPSLAGVTATDIINVTTHHRRLFFVFNDSLIFGYLPVVSVAGTVATFDIGGLCKRADTFKQSVAGRGMAGPGLTIYSSRSPAKASA